MKTRLQALGQLDRALSVMTDEELATLVASLPDDHRAAIDTISGARDGFADDDARLLALRAAAARGRVNGVLEQLTTILTDPCLADCITSLGDHADHPTEEQFLEVMPGLVERHGLASVRLMMAATVAGEAAAAVMLTRLLKSHDMLALPAREAAPAAVVVTAPEADEATKARRKEAKARKQAEARARREQQARAKNRI